MKEGASEHALAEEAATPKTKILAFSPNLAEALEVAFEDLHVGDEGVHDGRPCLPWHQRGYTAEGRYHIATLSQYQNVWYGMRSDILSRYDVISYRLVPLSSTLYHTVVIYQGYHTMAIRYEGGRTGEIDIISQKRTTLPAYQSTPLRSYGMI